MLMEAVQCRLPADLLMEVERHPGRHGVQVAMRCDVVSLVCMVTDGCCSRTASRIPSDAMAVSVLYLRTWGVASAAGPCPWVRGRGGHRRRKGVVSAFDHAHGLPQAWALPARCHHRRRRGCPTGSAQRS